jgi:hypothetical protein
MHQLLPQPEDCPFEDFVYMASLLEVQTITALPSEYEPIQYLRRSSSICGQRTVRHFTNDIPVQLRKFFKVVLEKSQDTKEQPRKLQMAKEFIDLKLSQYERSLGSLIEAKSQPGIMPEVLLLYLTEVKELKNYVESILDTN